MVSVFLKDLKTNQLGVFYKQEMCIFCEHAMVFPG